MSKKSRQAYYLTFYGFMPFETLKRNPFLPCGDHRPRRVSSNAKNTPRVCLTGYFVDGSDGATFFGCGISGFGIRYPDDLRYAVLRGGFSAVPLINPGRVRR